MAPRENQRLGISQNLNLKESPMLRYALIFFVLSLIAGFLGFGRASSAFGGIAKIFFFIFLVGLVLVLIGALATGSLVF